MAFPHRALEGDELSPGARKLVGPDTPLPLKLMAARGLAPVPPFELLLALYQFWVQAEPKLADEAGKTVTTLPPHLLAGALDDPRVPAGVLDFLARKLPRDQAVLTRVVRHPSVHDETLAGLARLCPEAICDLLAENEVRWLGCPKIVEALYQNPHCRMSVVHRMLELAVRQGIDLDLPNMEEIRITLGDGAVVDPSRDAEFRRAAGSEVVETHGRRVDRIQQTNVHDEVEFDDIRDERDDGFDAEAWLALDAAASDDLSLPMDEPVQEAAPEIEPEAEPEDERPRGDRVTVISKLKPMEKIRLALLGSAFERSILIRDSNKAVSMSAIKSPRVKENEAIAYAANRTLNLEVIRYIARRREWTKLYQVKLNLVLNPKTPMATSMAFLGHLHAHDVRKVARSRNIPSALAIAARRKAEQRG